MRKIEDFLNRIICGDTLEVLREMPDEIIDLGITSPPYNKKEKHGGWLVPKVKYTGYRDVMEEEDYQKWQIDVLKRTQKPSCRFPIELPTRIIHSILEDTKGTVINPFCGTGTTLVSAKLLEKDQIGIDISEEYVKYAERRLERASEEYLRVMKEIALHSVELSFRERKERGMWDKKLKKRIAERKTYS